MSAPSREAKRLMIRIEDIRGAGNHFATCTGRDVKVAIIDSGVNPAHLHVGGVAGGARIVSGEEDCSNDYLDYIGHGTAVAGAIREKAPDAQLYAVKVFDRALTTNIEAIVKAIDWCIENDMDLINLSLGTVNMEHREIMEQALGRASEKGTVLVAAREMSGKPSLPGCLPAVIGVDVDWQCARDRYTVSRSGKDPVFIASAYPRDIPGVPRERNMKGISFAVANMTGFVALAREAAPKASVDTLKKMLEAGALSGSDRGQRAEPAQEY
jgi:subtilisin family serine protease